MDPEHSLEELPEQLAGLVNAVAMSSVAVVNGSKAIRTWPVQFEEAYSMPFAAMNWRLFFSTTATSVIFFFFRTNTTFISVDVRVSASLTPSADNSRSIAAALGPGLKISFPTFLVTNLTDEEFVLFAPPGATRQNTLILALDPNQASLLAISFNAANRVRFSPNRVPGAVEQGNYSLAPLLTVIEILGHWDDKRWPLGPPVLEQGIANPIVNSIVARLTEAYTDITANLLKVPPALIGAVDLSCRNFSKYGAELSVSLRADGTLATSAEEERSVVSLKFIVPDSENNTPVVLPHFLVLQATGSLYDSIFETLLGDGLGAVSELLRLQDPQVARPLTTEFLDSARGSASFLPIDRQPPSRRYLAVLHGQLFGHDATTTLICTFEFAQTSETSVSWLEDGDTEPVALFQGSAEDVKLDQDSADQLFPLFINIEHWRNIL